MSREMTNSEAISNLNHIYGIVSPDIQRSLDLAIKALEERPQGEWIEKHSDYGVYYQCSICHKMPPNYECDYKEGAIKTNFCPNCGADMRGSKNETNN